VRTVVHDQATDGHDLRLAALGACRNAGTWTLGRCYALPASVAKTM
jgi:hypothetical protein